MAYRVGGFKRPPFFDGFANATEQIATNERRRGGISMRSKDSWQMAPDDIHGN
jgi:hypothetical protein